MEFLTDLLENSTMPWLTTLVLGLMTAISPCPLLIVIGLFMLDLIKIKFPGFNRLTSRMQDKKNGGILMLSCPDLYLHSLFVPIVVFFISGCLYH